MGTAVVDAFLDDGWDVVAVFRRRPEVLGQRPFRQFSVDLRDDQACRQAFSTLSHVTHVVYAALHGMPRLISDWTSQEQMDINLTMVRNPIEPLTEAADLRHVS